VTGSPFTGSALNTMVSPATISISIANASGSTAAFTAPATVTVTGIDATTGASTTATLTFTGTGIQTTSTVFSSITNITSTNIANARIQGFSNASGTQYDTAGTVVVDSGVLADTSRIAAASMPGLPGNAINALALLNIQQQGIIGNGQTAASFGDFYSTVVENLGAAAQQSHTGRVSQEQLVQHIQNQKLSVVGVNLDEEAAHLVALQHAYQAAARAITTQDSMLDTIINGMGLVGRG
jgi:flagellar hook-associated protein 1 FlgK